MKFIVKENYLMKHGTLVERREAVSEALREGRSHFGYRPERRRLMARDLVNAALGILLVIAIWWLVAEVVIAFKGAAFPTPPETFEALWQALMGAEVNGENIYAHTGASLWRWGFGYLLALVFGLLLGMIFGTALRLHDVGMVSIYVLQMIPGLAWIPIAMLIFGLGESATVFIILVTAMPPIVINTAGGIRQVPLVYTRVARMSGKDRWTLFFKVLIPGSALSIINGMRLGLANGWRVLIAAEMVVGVAVGLGYSIFQSRYNLDFTAAFVSIIVICIIGLIIEKIFFVSLENTVRNRLGIDRED
ncbi:MAG: ABC transporter permease subunit [Methanomassiliicoccales archaeon]|nr:ABC transporter permease subunit [Methanomassiliicoccales archaeon]